MAKKDYEIDFTEQDWEELGKELEKWAARGCYSRIVEKKITDPAMQYLKIVHGLDVDRTYEDVDFKENKLAYHAIFQILTCRSQKIRLGAVDFESIVNAFDDFIEKSEKCPKYNEYKVAYAKRANVPELKRLEKICEKYLKALNVMQYLGGRK